MTKNTPYGTIYPKRIYTQPSFKGLLTPPTWYGLLYILILLVCMMPYRINNHNRYNRSTVYKFMNGQDLHFVWRDTEIRIRISNIWKSSKKIKITACVRTLLAQWEIIWCYIRLFWWQFSGSLKRWDCRKDDFQKADKILIYHSQLIRKFLYRFTF